MYDEKIQRTTKDKKTTIKKLQKSVKQALNKDYIIKYKHKM